MISELMKKRNSCRNYKEEVISDDLIDELLKIAVKSPSGGGFQTYSIIKVTDDDKRTRLAELCRNQMFIKRAPVSLVFCLDYSRIQRINELEPSPCYLPNEFMNLWVGIIDATICAQTLCVTAEEKGLKSIYIGNLIHNLEESSELLGLPKHVIPVIMVTLGYPKSEGQVSPKYDIDVLVHNNTYQEMSDDVLLKAYHNKYSNWKMKISEKLMDKVFFTAENQSGTAFAELCKNDMIIKNRISPYQYWFGCYYTEDESFMTYADYVKFMKIKGFRWMEEK